MDLLHVVRPKFVVFSLVYILIQSHTWAFDDISSSINQVDVDKLTREHNAFSNLKLNGCWPSTQEYLAESYFTHHDDILDSDFNEFLAKVFSSSDSCKVDIDVASTLKLSKLKRHLNGDGSHRYLHSTFVFNVESDTLPRLDGQLCQAVTVERLPNGVFADPFEFQHLVHRKVFLNAAVLGDTNLELPSALSNRSIVEIHTNIGYNSQLKTFEIALDLPLHARYPPLSKNGYKKVEFGNPDLFLRCKKLETSPSSWTVSRIIAESAIVVWQIPSGNHQHQQFVSSATFGSALICSMLIVIFAIYFSERDEVKKD